MPLLQIFLIVMVKVIDCNSLDVTTSMFGVSACIRMSNALVVDRKRIAIMIISKGICNAIVKFRFLGACNNS